MLILGIETSCDETSAAVVEETGDASRPWRMRSNVIASQVAIHREWGGVVPELASRQHIRDICRVVDRALAEASTTWPDLGAVAVTQGPGLVGSLLVGVAREGHSRPPRLPLVRRASPGRPYRIAVLHNGPLPLPAVVLVVSGGHTSLYLVRSDRASTASSAGRATMRQVRLTTRWRSCSGWDIRAGRSSIVSHVTATTARSLLPHHTRLTHADRNAPAGFEKAWISRDFSFSGLKTAVLRHVNERHGRRGAAALHGQELADLCASFQRVVVEALLGPHVRRRAPVQRAAASALQAASRRTAGCERTHQARGEAREIPIFVPSLELSTDNAAMIAAGSSPFARGRHSASDLNAAATLAL